MNPATVSFAPIGVVRSGHTEPDRTPIQPVFAEGFGGQAEILPEFEEGLKDLDGFSHVILIYHLHRAGPARMVVKPFLQDVGRGVFATRAPCRPNAIGLSVVELVRREGRILHLGRVDLLDGTPLLDIKPYISRFDHVETARNGWHEEVDVGTAARLGRRQAGEGAGI